MPRHKLIIEYDGALFSGRQIQENAGRCALESAVKAICGEQVRSTVRAAPMPACMRWGRSPIAISKSRPARPPARRVEAHLRRIRLACSARIVADDFGAAAKSATTLSHHQPPRQFRARIGRLAGAAIDTMDARSRPAVLGKHDFTTFRDTECQAKSPEKTLDQPM
jgi:tRNA pseudouridine38-40 synthase